MDKRRRVMLNQAYILGAFAVQGYKAGDFIYDNAFKRLLKLGYKWDVIKR